MYIVVTAMLKSVTASIAGFDQSCRESVVDAAVVLFVDGFGRVTKSESLRRGSAVH